MALLPKYWGGGAEAPSAPPVTTPMWVNVPSVYFIENSTNLRVYILYDNNIFCPKLGDISCQNIALYNISTINTHTLTVIYVKLRGNRNKKVGKTMNFEENLGKIG